MTPICPVGKVWTYFQYTERSDQVTALSEHVDYIQNLPKKVTQVSLVITFTIYLLHFWPSVSPFTAKSQALIPRSYKNRPTPTHTRSSIPFSPHLILS